MRQGKYQILGTTWHVMHQTRLFHALKDEADFYILHNSWRDWHKKKFSKARPVPENVTFVAEYEPNTYDFAILHIDQQAVNRDIHKGQIYRELDETISDIPKVVINHGSPVYPEYVKQEDMTLEESKEEVRQEIKSMIGDNKMVTNSYQAAKDWGWGFPIVHGYNPDDWYNLPKEPRIFTALSPGGLEEYYNRSCMNETIDELKRQYDWEVMWAKVNCIQDGNFDDYREFMGGSLIYLDTSVETPMNGARTEAMLSGCCVVQVEGAHDLERFAQHDVNMVIERNNPNKIAETVNRLLTTDFHKAVEIGQEGRKMAMEQFSVKQYRDRWLKFIKEEMKL